MLTNHYEIKERLFFRTEKGFEGYKIKGKLMKGESIFLRTVFPPKLWGYNDFNGRKIPKCSWKVKVVIPNGDSYIDDEDAINISLQGGEYEYLTKYIKPRQGDVVKLYHKTYERNGETKNTLGYMLVTGNKKAESGRPAPTTPQSKQYESMGNKHQQSNSEQEVEF